MAASIWKSSGPLIHPLVAWVCALALVVSVVGGAPGESGPKKKQTRLDNDKRIFHVLNRLGFGPRHGDIERVESLGVDHYIEQQLYPEKIADTAVEAKLKELPTLTMSTGELLAKFPNPGMLLRQLQRRGEVPNDLAALRENRTKNPSQTLNADEMMAPTNEAASTTPKGKENEATKSDDTAEYRQVLREYYMKHGLQLPQRIIQELQTARILRAVYSERQLQEVMVDFWTNHFNVFAGKGADRWMLTSYDRDTIRPHTFSKFRDLVLATAQSPAMLFYLDNFQSVSPKPGAGGQGWRRAMRQMNDPQRRQSMLQPQRPRRGINENYARELMELHTLGVDGGYTQKDVQEVARCFTGWTIRDPRGAIGGQEAGRFYFNPRLHDDGEKIVLGQKIPAGGGINDGLMVIDILAKDPSTAKFIATKLCRRLVMDNPSPTLVQRVTAAFTKTDGDVRETLRAIFSSPEFNSSEAYRAKIKTPFELAVSAIRALGGETDARPSLHQRIARMGEPLYQYQAPTGYPDTAEAWVNTGGLLERLNFALALSSNRIPGTRVKLVRLVGDRASGNKVDQAHIVDQLLNLMLQGEVSPQTKATLIKQLNNLSTTPLVAAGEPETQTTRHEKIARDQRREPNAGPVNSEIARMVGLIIGSPEFQRQ